MKILMVCLGNICRSPLAEGVLQHKVGKKHFIDSAGIGNWHVGDAPDRRSIEVANLHGINISTQRAQHFHPDLFDQFDIIYAMDSSNFSDLIQLTRNENDKKKVKLFLKDALNELADVPDPYYGTVRDFEQVYELINNATDRLIEKYELAK